jgi:hypothetical protein
MVERAHGWPYRLLPVFHNRNFSYTSIVIFKSSAIRQGHPEDRKGKHFAVMDYQQTAALWIRGVLKHEFGVGYGAPSASGIDRAKVDLSDNAEYPLLFPDPKAEGMRYFKKTGIFPPHHTTACPREHPRATSVGGDESHGRVRESKEDCDRAGARDAANIACLRTALSARSARGDDDPLVYGVHANRKAIDLIQQISVEQGLTKAKQPLNDIFPETVITAEERL